MTLPLIAAPARKGRLLRGPWLVIAGRGGAVAAAQDGALRVIRQRGAGQVRLVRLLPGIALARSRHLVKAVMQPRVPFRWHLRGLDVAVVDDPAAVAAETAATHPL